MLKVAIDTKNLTADITIEDSTELTFLSDAVDALVTKQISKTTKTNRFEEIPSEEIDKLTLYQSLSPKLALGDIRLTDLQIMALERAVQEAINTYEEDVTDDPTDATLISYQAKRDLLREIGRKDLKKRQ